MCCVYSLSCKMTLGHLARKSARVPSFVVYPGQKHTSSGLQKRAWNRHINKPNPRVVAVDSEHGGQRSRLGCWVSPVGPVRLGSGGAGPTVAMVKCVVSGCPNRVASDNRGIFNRPPKRFFNFPKDPTRVKVPTCGSRPNRRGFGPRSVLFSTSVSRLLWVSRRLAARRRSSVGSY